MMAGRLGHRKPRNIIYYLITVAEDSKDMMKITVHGELNIYFSFHGKFYLQNHALRLPFGNHDSRGKN